MSYVRWHLCQWEKWQWHLWRWDKSRATTFTSWPKRKFHVQPQKVIKWTLLNGIMDNECYILVYGIKFIPIKSPKLLLRTQFTVCASSFTYCCYCNQISMAYRYRLLYLDSVKSKIDLNFKANKLPRIFDCWKYYLKSRQRPLKQ